MLQAFLFDLAKIDAAKKFIVQRKLNRARAARVIRRSNVTEHCDYFVTSVWIYSFFLRAASTKAIVCALLSLARC
jgi:hypothetical protein